MQTVVVTDRPERTVSVRIALDDVVLTETRYAAGERGPDPHVHRLHADCFYVLAGAITLSLDDGDLMLGPGTFALVPPNVVHAFRNDGPGDVRYLNLHAPGMGFDRYLQSGGAGDDAFLAEAADRFDQHAPPEDGGADPASVLVRTAETDTVTLGSVRVSFLANTADALGAIGLVEYAAPPSFPGPPVHVHEHTWDAYYVLEGRLAVRTGEETRMLEAGDVAVVPPGTPHGFSNPHDNPVRFLSLHAPGGFEQYFREAAAAAGDGPPDPAAMAQIASRYDVRPA